MMNYFELLDLQQKQGRKLGPMEWGCNCHAPVYPRREQVFTRMYPTKVNQEGICISCGHYAIRIEKSVLELEKQRRHGCKYKKKVR